MCLRDKVRFASGDMDLHFIHHILETNDPPAALWPYGYGEPLMYPHIYNVIRYARKKQIVVSLSTNGTYMDADAGRELLNSGLDYLIVAFDGATPETYAKYRKGANFQQVKGNVERLLTVKLAQRSPLHLTLQMILMEGTATEVTAFKKLWKRPGVDSVRIREDLLKYEERESREEKPHHRPCFFLWRGPLFVQAAGTVIPCPYYHGSEPFGDLKSQTADQAWNSQKMQELRQAHIAGDVSGFPTCAACPRYQPHAVLAATSFFVDTEIIRRYLPAVERLQQQFGWKLFE